MPRIIVLSVLLAVAQLTNGCALVMYGVIQGVGYKMQNAQPVQAQPTQPMKWDGAEKGGEK